MAETNWVAATAFSATLAGHILRADNPLRALCGERHKKWQPLQEFSKPEVFKLCATCSHIHRKTTEPTAQTWPRDEGQCGDGYLYGPEHPDLPRGDNGPPPNHTPKRSSAPWPTEPDRGALSLHLERTPKGRGQR